MNSPAPQPERAIYGFFLLSFALVSFIIYVIISYLPNTILNELGWDYLPDKYWSIALPAYIVIIILMVVPIYLSLNISKENDCDSINNILDEYSLDKNKEIKNRQISSSSIDPVYDIPIGDMCQLLYLKKEKI